MRYEDTLNPLPANLNDAGADGPETPPVYTTNLTGKAPWWAGSIAFFFVANAMLWHWGPAIVAGPWQQLAVESPHIYRRPVLTTWLAETLVFLVPTHGLDAQRALSILLGSVSCGLIAVLAAAFAGKTATRAERIACGVVAALLFAFTSTWQAAIEGGAPTTVTVALALGAFLFIQVPRKGPSLILVALAALLIGLASANNPAFAVLGLLLAVLALATGANRNSAVAILMTYGIGFAVGASIPVVDALTRGEDVRGFLTHALYTPYPTLGDAAPQLGYLSHLTTQFAWPTLMVSLGGLVLLIGKGAVRQPLAWAIVFLCMGPFLPSLTNQIRNASVIVDPQAAFSMVLVCVAVFAAWGLVAFLRVLLPAQRWASHRVVILVALGVALVAYQWRTVPAPPDDTARQLAEAILADCPDDAILVTGDAGIHSLLVTVQATCRVRSDLTIVPADALESVPMRRRLAAADYPKFAFSPSFPPSDALERWTRERPQAAQVLDDALRSDRSTPSSLKELALWELVRDNFSIRPVAFAGVAVPWLTARAQQNGVVLVYPRAGTPRKSSQGIVSAYIQRSHGVLHDTALHRTIAGLLLPAAEAARRQGDIAQASRIAELARLVDASNPLPWLASARAAARAGDREEAIAFLDSYLQKYPGRVTASEITAVLQEDLTRNAIAEDYLDSLDPDPLRANPSTRLDLVANLWALDELEVLARGYRESRQRFVAARDVDAVYEGAAILAQLGELSAARVDLGKAISWDAIRVWRRLRDDPRFSLLSLGASSEKLTKS